MSPLWQALLTAVVTLGAAFLGAGYAFRLNDNARARETTRARILSANRAIFVLAHQINTLKGIQKQIIAPHKNHPSRSIAMRPQLPLPDNGPSLDIDGLLFLLETEHHALVMELLVEEQRFAGAISSMQERSRLHLEVLQPKLGAAGIEEKVQYSPEHIRNVIGESLALHLERATNEAIEYVEETIDSNLEFQERFHAAMKKLFPGSKIVKYEFPTASNQMMESNA